MTAPLVVHDAASASADAQEIVMLLHDFSFKSPQGLLGKLSKPGASMDAAAAICRV